MCGVRPEHSHQFTSRLSSCLYLVSIVGSRDSKLALWKVRDYDDMSDSTVSSFISSISSIPSLNYQFGEPVEMKICDDAEKIRALAYNDQSLVSIGNRLPRGWNTATPTSHHHLSDYRNSGSCLSITRYTRGMYSLSLRYSSIHLPYSFWCRRHLQLQLGVL